MKVQKLICLIMAALLCLCMLSACNPADPGASQGGQAEPVPTEPGDGTPSLPEAQKLIRTVWLGAETEDLDTLLATVEARIAELGGYVESRKVYNGSSQSQNKDKGHSDIGSNITGHRNIVQIWIDFDSLFRAALADTIVIVVMSFLFANIVTLVTECPVVGSILTITDITVKHHLTKRNKQVKPLPMLMFGTRRGFEYNYLLRITPQAIFFPAFPAG